MISRFAKSFRGLETEEQILNGGVIVALVGTLLPWMSGEWLDGNTVAYSGFGFFTAFIGITIFLLQLFLILLTLLPLLGGPVIVRKRHREIVRLCIASASALLILSAVTVLLKVTLEFTRMEMRFGIYVTLIGCLVTLLYAFLRFQEQRRMQAQELFHHPEDAHVPQGKERGSFVAPPPPPPPPPPAVEEHRLYP